MADIDIRPATRADLPGLHDALTQLSALLGDRHAADLAALAVAGFGPEPVFRALIASTEAQIVGVLLCSPLFSTIRGGGGLYVSDLWVAEKMRGSGLGQRLLAHAVAMAEVTTGARFVRLSVYRDNPAARQFYERLGFTAQADETGMILSGPALDSLKGKT